MIIILMIIMTRMEIIIMVIMMIGLPLIHDHNADDNDNVDDYDAHCNYDSLSQ